MKGVLYFKISSARALLKVLKFAGLLKVFNICKFEIFCGRAKFCKNC